MSAELYKKYRPKNLADIVGQSQAVAIISKWAGRGNFPHAMLFTGPSGCGKTTLARIIKRLLECSDADYAEKNSADYRGIDTVRDIRNQYYAAPMSGRVRIYSIDEAHQLTKDAQNALLKMLEDTPKHVYFMLSTTDPQKLIAPVKTRCSEIKVKQLTDTEICELVASVVTKEVDQALYPPDEVIQKIAELAEGSARKALVLLEAILHLETVDDQLDALEKSDHKSQSIELCRLLIRTKPRPAQWPEVAKVLQGLDHDTDSAEKMRRAILGYARSCLIKGGPIVGRAFLIIQAFRDHFYDCGEAGLAAACYEVISGK